jgi:ribonuclease-3
VPNIRARQEQLEELLGHRFQDPNLLLRALTHKSLLAEQPANGGTPLADNEQFEFFGDSILGFLASDYLIRLCPHFPEGNLSKLKAMLVSSAHLYETAKTLGLGGHLLLGKGEEMSGGRNKKALLANAVEAIIAAMYLDGGLEPCRRFLERYVWGGVQLEELGNVHVPVDSKSALQELAQARKLPVPRYAIVHESGPEHAKIFTVEARVGKEMTAQAEGASKKAAGQLAAERLLRVLREMQAAD